MSFPLLLRFVPSTRYPGAGGEWIQANKPASELWVDDLLPQLYINSTLKKKGAPGIRFNEREKKYEEEMKKTGITNAAETKRS